MSSRDPLSLAFAALADPTRRAILERLALGEVGVVELAEASTLTQPAITKHLKVLERAGLVGRARDGQRRPARLQLDGLLPVDDWRPARPYRLVRPPRPSRGPSRRSTGSHYRGELKCLRPAPLWTSVATPTRQLLIERTLDAPPDRVFDAFTDPDQLKQWWWPNGFSCPAAEVDLRVGGRYRLAMEWPDFIPADAQFSHYLGGGDGRDRSSAPPRHERPGHQRRPGRGLCHAHRVDLRGARRGTALTVRQSYFEPMPPADALAGAEQGWSEQLDKLEGLLAG